MSRKKAHLERTELTDEELMQRYQDSDFLAFEVLYQRHSGRIYQYLVSKVGSETGQELLQDVFARIHRSRDKYNTQYPFLPWLFTVVRNLLKDHYKRAETQRVMRSTPYEDISHLTATNWSEVFHHSDLENSLSSLPANQQLALRRRYLDDWSFEKIALEIQTSPQNVRQLVSRGLYKIRSTFRQAGEKK